MDIRRGSLALIGLLFVPAQATADWAFMSQHKQLEGHAIAAVGSVSQESKYLPDAFKRLQWYAFKQGFATDFCFEFAGLEGIWGFGDKPALLLVDKDENVKLALFDAVVGGVKVEMHRINQISCPNPY
jgi:hypothetical protein